LLEMADTVINNRDVIQKAESGAEKWVHFMLDLSELELLRQL
jgi:hypothetical protein